MSDTPAQTPRGGVQILIDWANQQDHWVRAIVSDVIAIRRELPGPSIDVAYEMLLAEKALSEDVAPNVPVLSAGVATAEAAEELRLVRLAQLTGVNALASGQEIAFNPKLTVLFGENAAGKTGYVRVLKRVASVRSAQPILGDINSTASGKPHATIDYTLAGAANSLDWNDEVGVPPFTRMSVFDSSAVSLARSPAYLLLASRDARGAGDRHQGTGRPLIRRSHESVHAPGAGRSCAERDRAARDRATDGRQRRKTSLSH
jgi:hypothetical protein